MGFKSKHRVPRLPAKLLRYLCKEALLEEIEGDLFEHYQILRQQHSKWKANVFYWFHVLHFLRPFALKKFGQNSSFNIMIKSYLISAWRNSIRHKSYSLINLLGLVIGITTCIFIAAYVKHEGGFDRHFTDSEKIFRVVLHSKFSNNEAFMAAAPAPMARGLKDNFPEVVETARVSGSAPQILSINGKSYKQDKILWADQSFFEIFQFTVLEGDPRHFLDEPNTVVIDQSTKEKFFGTGKALGKVIKLGGQTDLKITGVVEDLPDNIHFQSKVFITLLNKRDSKSKFWLGNNYTTYVKLNNPHAAKALNSKIASYMLEKQGPQFKQYMDINMEQALTNNEMILDYQLQPIERIHLYSKYDFGVESNGSIQTVKMFVLIGSFILLISCINFTNLSTARASIRTKEIGLRKVLGSRRTQLISQILFEAFLNSALAMTVAIGVFYLLLPQFNVLTGGSFIDPIFEVGGLWPYLILATFLITILAGAYPAYFFSSFGITKILKGKFRKGKSAVWLRNVFVTIQFSTSIFLIITSLLIFNQLKFLQEKDLGFDKESVLIINETQLLGNQIDLFKEEMLKNPYVQNVTFGRFIPSSGANSNLPYYSENQTTSSESVTLQNWPVDYDYASTFGIELIAGRFFSKNYPTDSAAVVMNQTALERFGYKEDPLGKKIKTDFGSKNEYTIIGVIKDFHLRSPIKSIQPQILVLDRNTQAVSLKFETSKSREVIEKAEGLWNKFSEEKPFEYSFLDQLFQTAFEAQSKTRTIFTLFAFLAISISCLGLFGLAAFISEQRKKEVGIRKVLGASNVQLFKITLESFTNVVIISACIAMPAAWLYIKGWLSDFAYQDEVRVYIFLIGGLGALIIAWVTAGYQSIKVAKTNPVESLRQE